MDDMETISKFEVRECDLAGRIGKLTVRGKTIETPNLMPVVNPNITSGENAVTPEELKETFGHDIIITNSYIIRRGDRLRERALDEGLHKLLDYDGMIMTDSGTFQSYMYGSGKGKEVNVTPLEIVEFQRDIGSDIGTILDKFTVPSSTWDEAKQDLDITLDRGSRSLKVMGDMELAIPVQGGVHMDLRELSGRSVREMGSAYSPIGGVVPLMESYRYSDLVDVIVAGKRGLGPSIPTHLFGAGHPMILPLAAALGCDLFDSASYAKFAQGGRYMTRDRTRHLREIDSFPCSCPVCSRYDPSDLKEMEEPKRVGLLSRHNLWSLRGTMNEIRISLKEGTIWEMVERSALYHPAMYSAVRRLEQHKGHLEESAPRSTRRFMCSDLALSRCRPEFQRFKDGLTSNYRTVDHGRTLILTDWGRTHSHKVEEALKSASSSGDRVVIRTPLGPAPYDIEDMYPISQSVFPQPESLTDEVMEGIISSMEPVIRGSKGEVVHWTGAEDPPETKGAGDEASFLALKVANIARMQFGIIGGKGADEILFGSWDTARELASRLIIKRSRRTGKIRNVMLPGKDGEEAHLLSLRAEDGMFTLKLEGARRLHEGGTKWKVVVEDDTGEYNAQGYNVFC
ncbi:MAG: tRNA guanosine(15) transglycosylase TgtA, partial [Thermoplasmata archaeon]|nr:tRNA guanosine(15) transglycosylase TgtA [Thermoplasmata archaeon]